PVITERRNSMITGTCARSVAGLPNRAYPRGLLIVCAAFPQVPEPLVDQLRTVAGSSSRSGRAGRSAWNRTSGGPTTWCTAGRSPRPGSSGCTAVRLYGAHGYDQR
ncbi:hypothetical protein ACWEQN_20465, partial [Streptomyces sp. NPDC004129]